MQNDPPPPPAPDDTQTPTAELPTLGPSPARHPHCCLSLSLPILAAILSRLPAACPLALSVGSGSGLLEQLLRRANPRLDLHGAEVAAGAQNAYLPADRVRRVAGTWQVCAPLAARASAWLFVYPRSPALVRAYLDGTARAARLEVVLWIGPAADWELFEAGFWECGLCGEADGPEIVRLTDSEIMAVAVPGRVGTGSVDHEMVNSL
jgi:hypothetical protein